jgi:hypothetical protein
MQRPDSFGGALNPERIVEAAVSDLFSGPLPIFTQSVQQEASAEEKEFIEMASAFRAFEFSQAESEKTTSSSNLRRLISLNEAIRFGKFNALENEKKENVLVFEDFENLATAPRAPFSMAITEVNNHLYTTLLNFKNTRELTQLADTRKARSKILADPQASLTENELLAYQAPLILAFLTHADIKGPKLQLHKEIQEDNDKSNNQKKELCAKIEKDSTDASDNRMLYLAALATQNPASINQERHRSFQSPFITSATLAKEIAHLREKARLHRSPLGALFSHMSQAHGATVIDADDCNIS